MKVDWKPEKLGSIIQLEYGKPLPKQKRKPNGKHPVYGANGEKTRTDEYYYDRKSIIVGRKGSAGEINLSEEKFWPLDVTYFVTFDAHKHNLYFLYYLLSNLELPKLAKGVKPGINRNEVYALDVAIPPITEQERIVAILDETFAALSAARVNAEKNLSNARELFETLLNEYFGHARKAWKEITLNDACIVERGSSPRPIKKYQTTSKDGVNWIKIGDTKGVEKYIYSTKEKITSEGAKKSRFVKEGDFILSNSMSFGYPYIMKTEGYIHDGWFVLRLKEFIDTEFFWYLLAAPFVRNQFNRLASGAIVKNISSDLVKKAELFIPPIDEQRAIVAKLDALSAETKRLEDVYQRKLAALEEMRKSVLQKAFAGEL